MIMHKGDKDSMKSIKQGSIVTLAGLGVNLTLGVLYAWGVISAALIDQLGWSATQTQIPYMTACAFFAFFMVPGGRLQDKFGPRPIVMLAALLTGLGFFLAGATLTVVGLTIFFGLVFGIAMGMGYAAPTPAAVKWFCPQKRGLISGIVVSGFGLAPIYIAPLTTGLIHRFGIQNTFYLLGAIFFFAIILLAQLICNPPPGFKPIPSKSKKQAIKSASKDFEVSQVLRTPQFYLLWTMFCFGTFAGLLTIGQMVKIGIEQASMQSTFILIASYAFFNFFGRISWGVISDRIGRKTSLLIVFSIQLLTYALFPFLVTPAHHDPWHYPHRLYLWGHAHSLSCYYCRFLRHEKLWLELWHRFHRLGHRRCAWTLIGGYGTGYYRHLYFKLWSICNPQLYWYLTEPDDQSPQDSFQQIRGLIRGSFIPRSF
jgi:MFS transporter, OFA family, oxalate/formate antiporter